MNELQKLREQIDELDKIIADAYSQRLDIVHKIGEYKKNNNISVLDGNREQSVYDNVVKSAPRYEKEICDLYKFIMDYSKKKQSEK